jgi:hypothetical protein
MYNGEIFLSIQDMMKLLGSHNYENARKRHKAVRDAIKPGKKSLSIHEFCKHEDLDYEEIWKYLRDRPLPA